MAESIYSGNQASDYQPPTRNPQSDVNGSLQPNSSNLQPVSGQNGVSQQSLPTVSTLQVINNGPQLESRPIMATRHGISLTLIILLVFLILVAVITSYLAKLKGKTKLLPVSAVESAASVQTTAAANSPKKKKSSQSPKKRPNRPAKKRR